MTEFEYGKLAYEAYCEAAGCPDPAGFEKIVESAQKIWIHVAAVIRSES